MRPARRSRHCRTTPRRTCALTRSGSPYGPSCGRSCSRSAPAECRSDVLEDAFEHVGVVVHAQLIRDREEQRIGRRDGLVAGERLDEDVGLRGVRAAEDGPSVGVDVADLILVAGIVAEVFAVAVVDDREDAAADGHPWLTPVSCLLPGLTIGVDLLALLDVQQLTRDDVRGTGIFGHVHRVFVAHVDDGGPDLDRLRARADGGEERERRAELAREVVYAEVRAIEAQLFSGYGELDRLQKDIRRRAGLGVSRWCPVPEGEKAELLHERTSEDETACSIRLSYGATV